MKISRKIIVIIMGSVFGGFMAFKGARAALAEPETWDDDDFIDEIFPDEESENKEAEAKAEA